MSTTLSEVQYDQLLEKASDAVAAALGDAYDCMRVWSAWSYGTMGPDDFYLVAEDSSRVSEITMAVLEALDVKKFAIEASLENFSINLEGVNHAVFNCSAPDRSIGGLDQRSITL